MKTLFKNHMSLVATLAICVGLISSTQNMYGTETIGGEAGIEHKIIGGRSGKAPLPKIIDLKKIDVTAGEHHDIIGGKGSIAPHQEVIGGEAGVLHDKTGGEAGVQHKIIGGRSGRAPLPKLIDLKTIGGKAGIRPADASVTFEGKTTYVSVKNTSGKELKMVIEYFYPAPAGLGLLTKSDFGKKTIMIKAHENSQDIQIPNKKNASDQFAMIKEIKILKPKTQDALDTYSPSQDNQRKWNPIAVEITSDNKIQSIK